MGSHIKPSQIHDNLMSLVCSRELGILGCCKKSIRACQVKGITSSKYDREAPVHVTFVDWILGISSLLGYLIINLIDKDRDKVGAGEA